MLRRLKVLKMAINATFFQFLQKVSLWRSAPSTEYSMVLILTHLLTTFSKDILISTTSKPTYGLHAGLNAAFCYIYFPSFAPKALSRGAKPSIWQLLCPINLCYSKSIDAAY